MCERAAGRGSGQARDLGGEWGRVGYHQGRVSGVSQFKGENKFDTLQYQPLGRVAFSPIPPALSLKLVSLVPSHMPLLPICP